ncbi:MAG: hypothetical protein ACI8RD_014574, partial [Bacillariaceae sp.]|jgi:hypothetical protein
VGYFDNNESSSSVTAVAIGTRDDINIEELVSGHTAFFLVSNLTWDGMR